MMSLRTELLQVFTTCATYWSVQENRCCTNWDECRIVAGHTRGIVPGIGLTNSQDS
jgi:hypothetical protein